jgi:hypothetical protein
MMPPNNLANMLFSKMFQIPTKPIPPRQLIPAGLISDFNLLPQHHPADIHPEHPDFNRRTQAVICIARQLEIDFKSRRMALNAFLRIIRAFRFDYLQLRAGFAPVVPANEAFDTCLDIYASNMESTDDFMVVTFVDLYEELYVLTQNALTVTPEAVLENIRREEQAREEAAAEAQVAA